MSPGFSCLQALLPLAEGTPQADVVSIEQLRTSVQTNRAQALTGVSFARVQLKDREKMVQQKQAEVQERQRAVDEATTALMQAKANCARAAQGLTAREQEVEVCR